MVVVMLLVVIVMVRKSVPGVRNEVRKTVAAILHDCRRARRPVHEAGKKEIDGASAISFSGFHFYFWPRIYATLHNFASEPYHKDG
ncbi:unnamed protein product [Victoria cruziana]